MVGIWEEYGRALIPPINICLLMCPLTKQLVLPSVYLFNTESTAVEIYMHWLVAMRGWLKFIEWYSKWPAQAHRMMGMSTSDDRCTASSRCTSSGWCTSSGRCTSSGQCMSSSRHRCNIMLLMGMGVEEQVHVEGQVHIEWPVHVEWLVHVEWQAHIEQLVNIEQWAQVWCHIVVDGNGIKGDGGGWSTVVNGDGAEWRSWVLWWVWARWMAGTHQVAELGGGDGVQHCGWFSKWAREGPSSNSTQ